MKIEILYPEFCNLNGDMGNIEYLKKCLPDVQIVETEIDAKPEFISRNDISLVYMGTLSERGQEIAINQLKPYTQKIIEKIEKNQLFLLTGNSIEVFGKYIENEDGSKIEGLGIFDVYAKRNMLKRHNSFFLGEYEKMDIVGFKSQFTMLYGDNSQNYFLKTNMGIGINEETKLEGIHKNNFFATYVIGPFLVLNPLFTLNLLRLMGEKIPSLAYEKDILEAYHIRLLKFKEIQRNEK